MGLSPKNTLVRTTWQAGKPEKHSTSAGNFGAILYGFCKNGKKMALRGLPDKLTAKPFKNSEQGETACHGPWPAIKPEARMLENKLSRLMQVALEKNLYLNNFFSGSPNNPLFRLLTIPPAGT